MSPCIYHVAYLIVNSVIPFLADNRILLQTFIDQETVGLVKEKLQIQEEMTKKQAGLKKQLEENLKEIAALEDKSL